MCRPRPDSRSWMAVVKLPVPGPSSTTTASPSAGRAAIICSARRGELGATAAVHSGWRRNSRRNMPSTMPTPGAPGLGGRAGSGWPVGGGFLLPREETHTRSRRYRRAVFRRLLHEMVMDVQYGRLRLVPVVAVTAFVLLGLLFGDPGDDGRALLLIGVVLFVGGGRWPLPVALGETAFLVVTTAWFGSPPAAVSLLAGVALLELVIRRPVRQGAGVAVVLTVVYASAAR